MLVAALGALALLGVVVVFSLSTGPAGFGLPQAWAEWRSGAMGAEAPALRVLLLLRLPRTLAALLAGAGLAVAGCVFQAILRNPLAEPYTLGVAGFSALGAWCAYLLMDGGWLAARVLGVPPEQVFAFVFALGEVLLIFGFAARRARMSPAMLLLAGVTAGILANAGILFTRYIARPDRIILMDRWLMGGVDVVGFDPVLVLAAGVLPCFVLLWSQGHRFDQLGFNLELAAARGVGVARFQLFAFLMASLLTAVIVAQVGPIGFVGLVVPHVVRVVTGPLHRVLLPACFLVGGVFLCACDATGRLLLPGETPIGIITTLIGGPFFLYLLLRRRFTAWEI
jgi:iron complex transport system permease protein